MRMYYGKGNGNRNAANGNGNHTGNLPLPDPRAFYDADYGRDRSFTNHSDRERMVSAASRSHAIMIGSSGSYDARAGAAAALLTAGGDGGERGAIRVGSAPGDTRYDRLGGRAQEREVERERMRRGLERERMLERERRASQREGKLSSSPMTPVVGERFRE